MSFGTQPRVCPCGAMAYDECCGPLHRGERQAGSPEELMRSRFSAYALSDTDYVWRTWHPSTRPEQVTPDAETRWTRLEIVESTGDTVEFRAHFEGAEGVGVLHERSRFAQRAGRWFYLDSEGS